jgi:DnaD/phage-associated family protein
VVLQHGFIKLHRKIQDHWIYQEKRKFSRYEAWLDMLMMANHKDNKFLLGNELVEVEKGSFITSELKLMERWDWGKGKLRTFLEMLENDGMIVKKSDRKKTTITICNYCVYHHFETENGPQADHERTTSGPSADTNKNVKKDKKEKNKSINSNITSQITTFWDLNGFGLNAISSKQKLLAYMDEGLDGEVVLKALEVAVDMNKVSYSYVEKILKNWISRGVKNLHDVQALQAEYEQSKQKRTGTVKKSPKEQTSNIGNPLDDEVIKQAFEAKKNEKLSDEELAAQKRAIEERLKQYIKETNQ